MKRPNIAYLVSRFPKITETFILYEMQALEAQGAQIELFPLVREREPVRHTEAEKWMERAHYSPILGRAVLKSQVYWLLRSPLRLLGLWAHALWGHRGSRKYLLRAAAALLLAGHFGRQMQALGIQHIHAHWATHTALAAFAIRRLTGIPYSFTAHAHDIYVERMMLAQKIREARFVVTISDHNRRLLCELYGEEAAKKVRLVRCGTDTSVFIPGENGREESSAPFRIVCVGALEEKKGQTYLIEACRLLARRGFPLECLLIGDGELRPALQAQIRAAGLEEKVKLLGTQPRERVSALLKEAQVVVMPSIRLKNGKMEGIPVALMEALAVEAPVVASAISGIPELVVDGETGLLVPERDPSALAQAIASLQRNPRLGRRLGKNGRKKVLAEYDLVKNTRSLYSLLTGQELRLARPARYGQMLRTGEWQLREMKEK